MAMALPSGFVADLERESAGTVVNIVKSYIKKTLEKNHLVKQRKSFTKLVNLHKRRRPAPYAEIAVLSNLASGLDALEEGLVAGLDDSARIFRLKCAENMLQVCAEMHCARQSKTAGLPNSYLVALAHLNLAYIHFLWDQDRQATMHILEMFVADASYSRLHFAPGLWHDLFFTQLREIMAWFLERRHHILSSGQMSSSQEIKAGDYLDMVAACATQPRDVLNSQQVSQMKSLEDIYEVAMDENTRQHARYYKSLMNSESAHAKLGVEAPRPVDPPMNATNHVELLDFIMHGFESFSISTK